MSKLIIANWKLNPMTIGEAVRLARAEDRKGTVIAAPFPFLVPVQAVLKRAKLGAQDLFWEKSGPHTGEVSAAQLKSLGVEYVIVGHSERRALGETDEMINKKIKTALAAGLKVILCVGETWRIRKRGIGTAKRFVQKQLQKDLRTIKLSSYQARSFIIAYEPTWAIGTGKSDNPEEANEMAKFIKKTLYPKPYNLKPKVLYGGSVTAKNAKSFLDWPEVDGVLVGGASLKPKEFEKIHDARR